MINEKSEERECNISSEMDSSNELDTTDQLDSSSESDTLMEFEPIHVENIHINKIIQFDSELIINSCIAFLENGNYFISYCVETTAWNEPLNEIIIYDPIEEQIIKKINFEKFVSKVKSAENKIVIEWFPNQKSYDEQNLTVFDEDLNIICEKQITEKTLISATDTYILCAYCDYSDGIRTGSWSWTIYGFDWSLKEIHDSSINKHLDIGERCAELVCFIDQFEQVVDNFIVRLTLSEQYIGIFHTDGKEIAIKTSKSFVIDSDDNIILYDFDKKNSLEFLDLDGNFIRWAHFGESLKGKEFMMDSNGTFYFVSK